MSENQLHSKKELAPIRKILRSNITPAEAFLWKHPKTKKLEGRRFKKQHSLKKYIVEFYCTSERLIIDLDGETHNNPSAME